MEPLEPSQRCVWHGSSRSWFWSPSRSRANRPVLRLFQAASPSTSFANLDLDLDQTSMDRPKKRPGNSSPPESHAGSRQSTSTEREVRSSPQAQSASALGRARKRQGHSCARELVTGSGEPTSTAREARPSPPAPSAAVLADRLGHNGIILLLFETPSGFAIFKYYGVQLFLPDAKENIWSKFINNDKTRLVSALSPLLFVVSLSCFSPI